YSFHPTLYADSITFGGDSSCYSTPCAVSASQDLMMHGYEPALGAGPPLMSASSPSSSALSTGTGRTLATLCASAPTSLTPIEQYHSSSASSSFVDHCFAASASSLDSCHNGSLMTLDTYINDNSCQQYYQQPQYYHLQPQQLQQQQQHLHSVGRSSTSCINSCQDLLNASFTSQLSTASTNSTLLDPGTLSSHMPTKMTMLQSAAVTRSANQFSVSASSSASSASTATTTSTASAASTVEQQHLDHHSSFNRSDGGSSIQSDCTHTNEADYHPYTCQWFDCYLSFIDMHEFVKHLEEVHVNSTSESKHKYYCAWQNCRRADQPFNARYKLLIHMRVHSGEKPYPCEQDSCRKSFSRLENLKIHNRSHTGEKPYSCKYDGCNKAFTNSSDRIKHHKTHVDAADDNLLKSSQDSLRESDQDQVLSYSWTGESFVKRIYGNNNNAYHNKNNWTTATVDNRDDDSNLSDIYDYNNNHSRLASSFTSGCAPMFNANSNNHHRRASMFELPSVSLQNNHSLFVVPPSTDIMNSTNSVHQDGLQVDTLL
ncbi:Zinc finger protein GLIS3, partial [Fragariocoptes setiger]